MRNSVSILLNERESVKREAARQLEQRLRDIGWSVERLEISSNIEEVLTRAPPSVLIVDYLLGDITTGLDLLAGINRNLGERTPQTIFYTDEPSASVAVSALKLGALDYFEIDRPSALESILKIMTGLMPKQVAPSPGERLSQTHGLADLVFAAPASKEVLRQLQLSQRKRSPINIFCGPAGVGLRTLAQANCLSQTYSANVRVLDLAYFADDLVPLFTRLDSRLSGLPPFQGLVLLNAQEDDGEILALLKDDFPDLWHNQDGSLGAMLNVCTHSLDCAAKWRAAFPQVELINVPDLEERKSEFPQLLQHFCARASSTLQTRIAAFDNELQIWLGKQSYPENLRQLCALVTDAICLEQLEKRSYRDIFEELFELWRSQPVLTGKLDPLLAAFAVNQNAGNLRRAAVAVGVPLATLKETLCRVG